MMLPVIKYNGSKVVYCADLLPSAAHIPLPYVMGYDVRPLITIKEKEAFLKEACEKKHFLFFEHDSLNECCSLEKTDKGIRPKNYYALSELPVGSLF